jgi:hypothetical protein
MRNLANEWAIALVEDLTLSPPTWKPQNLTIHPAATTASIVRPALLVRGTEEARTHPRLAVGAVEVELHWHRNDGTPAEAREMLQLAAREIDTRRNTISIPDAVMTWFMPDPDEEETREDGWVFRAIRSVRFRAVSVASA